MLGNFFEGVFEQAAGGAGDGTQIRMQVRVFGVLVQALLAVGLKTGQLRDQLGHMFGALAQDFGQLGHSPASRRLFCGNYVFPTDYDTATRDLLEDIAHLKTQFQNVGHISDAVTTEDYISFWKTSKEATASSKSG